MIYFIDEDVSSNDCFPVALFGKSGIGTERKKFRAVGKRGGNTIDFVQQRERGLRVGKLETEIIRYLVEVGFRALGDFKREH